MARLKGPDGSAWHAFAKNARILRPESIDEPHLIPLLQKPNVEFSKA